MKILASLVLLLGSAFSQGFSQTICNPVVVGTTADISGALSCSSPPCANAIIKTRGYSSVDDGGGAEYIVVKNPSSPSNTPGIDFLICSSGSDYYYAMFNFQGSIIAEQAGILPGNSGTVNNSALVNLFSTYLKGKRGAGVVYLTPEAVYTVMPASLIHAGSDWTLDGRGATIYVESSASVRALFYFNEDVSNIKVENIVFDGEANEDDYVYGLVKTNNCRLFNFTKKVGDFSFENVVVKDNYAAINTTSGGGDIRILNSDFIDVVGPISASVHSAVVVDNCSFSGDSLEIDTSKIADADKFHNFYVGRSNLYISNTTFKNSLGECVKTFTDGDLYVNNCRFDDGGRIYSSSDHTFINNVNVVNQADFLDLVKAGSRCLVNNLHYVWKLDPYDVGLPIRSDVQSGYAADIKVSNSYFEGSSTFQLEHFGEYIFDNVTIVNPMVPARFVFHQNENSSVSCQALFNQLRVVVDEIPVGTLAVNNISVFLVQELANRNTSIHVSNSQFVLNAPNTGGVFVARYGSNSRMTFSDVGAKGWTWFIKPDADQSKIVIDNLYEIGSKRPYKDMFMENVSVSDDVYLQQYVECSSDGITISLEDKYPEFVEILIIPDDSASTTYVDAETGSTYTINGDTTAFKLTDPTRFVRIGTNWTAK